MSVQITTAFVEQYKSNVFHLAQQKGSRLRDAVRTETVLVKHISLKELELQLHRREHHDMVIHLVWIHHIPDEKWHLTTMTGQT